MPEYLVDSRDLQFVLFEQFKLHELAQYERYQDFAREDYEMIFDEALKLAKGVLAPLSELGDREGCRLEDGVVVLPAGFKEAYKQFCDDGWMGAGAAVKDGGQGLPLTLNASLVEFYTGANAALMFFPGLTSAAANLIAAFASETQRATYLKKMFSGAFTGTMCLTEPNAGSAVGELTTSATPIEGTDHYHISGGKIFISAGDHELSENIIHLVLARVKGDLPGIKGLSLFIVPKYRLTPSGGRGDLNNVETVALEDKMGIHASPTCQLAFGAAGECQGELIGQQGQGIICMFKMMNEARIITGLQGVALANAAYQHALAYARERMQGGRITDRSADAPQVPIIDHPDVRRNLMLMKTMSEGIRALLHQAAFYADMAHCASEEADRLRFERLLELLTPICKAYATDEGFWVTERAIQVFGGYGYISEYPAEQYMRDSKIASLYEGTNGIQALDLLGRKMRMDGGALFMTWIQETTQFLQSHQGHARLAALVTAVDKAKNQLGEVAFGFTEVGPKDPELFVLQATPFLEMFGHVETARLLVHQALLADDALQKILQSKGLDCAEAPRSLLEEDAEARFYDGKIKGARFFVSQILPKAGMLARAIKQWDRSALEICF